MAGKKCSLVIYGRSPAKFGKQCGSRPNINLLCLPADHRGPVNRPHPEENLGAGQQLRKSEQNGFHDNLLISQPNPIM